MKNRLTRLPFWAQSSDISNGDNKMNDNELHPIFAAILENMAAAPEVIRAATVEPVRSPYFFDSDDYRLCSEEGKPKE